MASSASRGEKRNPKHGGRKLVQPALPTQPFKPRSSRIAENPRVPTKTLTANPAVKEPRSLLLVNGRQSAEPRVLQNLKEHVPRPSSPDGQPRILYYDSNREGGPQSDSEASSRTEKASSVPDSSSTPASELTNASEAQPNADGERSTVAHLRESLNEEETSDGDWGASARTKVFTPLQSLSDSTPSPTRSFAPEADRGIESVLDFASAQRIDDTGDLSQTPGSSEILAKTAAMLGPAHISPGAASAECGLEHSGEDVPTGCTGKISRTPSAEAPFPHSEVLFRGGSSSGSSPEKPGLEPRTDMFYQSDEALLEQSDPSVELFRTVPMLSLGLHMPALTDRFGRCDGRPVGSQTPPIQPTFPDLKSHLHLLLHSRQIFDWIINVRASDATHFDYSEYALGAMLSRSSTFREMMGWVRNQQTRSALPFSIDWSPPIYIPPPVLTSVLEYMYTDTLLTRSQAEHMTSAEVSGENIPGLVGLSTRNRCLTFVILYCLSGILLDLPSVHDEGWKLLDELIDWDVSEQAVTMAHKIFYAATFAKSYGEPQQPPDILKLYEPFVSVSSVPIPINITHIYPAQIMSLMRLARNIYGCVESFILQRWEPDLSNFSFQAADQQIISTYLPKTAELDSALRKINSNLQRIQFGSLPNSDDSSFCTTTNASLQSRVVSAILVNIPFPDLYCFHKRFQRRLLHTHDDSRSDYAKRDDVFGAIVREREKRREVALQSRSVSSTRRYKDLATWEVVAWRESFVQGERASFIKRELTSFMLP